MGYSWTGRLEHGMQVYVGRYFDGWSWKRSDCWICICLDTSNDPEHSCYLGAEERILYFKHVLERHKACAVSNPARDPCGFACEMHAP